MKTLDERVAEVRAFNRWWSQAFGLLKPELVETAPFSLTEARVLYELAQREATVATDLVAQLGIDRGYVSRILRGFKQLKLIAVSAERDDARRKAIRLTAAGRAAFAQIDDWTARAVGTKLAALDEAAQRRVVGALGAARGLLEDRARGPVWSLRGPLPGDLGWIVERHGAVYAREYGWDARFEGLVARVCADFAASDDLRRQRAWIAEVDGERAGSILCTRKDDATAQLRLLLVEPAARGLGVGARLVDECVRFARGAGYRRMTLWTSPLLTVARHLYERAGFRLIDEAPHDRFGEGLTGQTWSLELGASASASATAAAAAATTSSAAGRRRSRK